MISYQQYPIKTTLELKTSQSPRNRPHQMRQMRQKFVHPSDPTINFATPYCQSSKNATTKQQAPTLFHSNQIYQAVNQTHAYTSKSPLSKENKFAKRTSHKSTIPSPSKQVNFQQNDSQWIRDRVNALELQISGFLHENKQLTKVLDQQIQINQSLKDQLKIKTLETQNFEKVRQNTYSTNSICDDQELKQILDQLQIYKQIVESLEVKINNVVGQNNNLNECVEQTQQENDTLKQQLMIKYNNNGDDYLKLKEENAIFRQNSDTMEIEITEMRNHIELFKQHIINIKSQFNNPQTSCVDDKEVLRLVNENCAFKQQILQKDNSIRYLEQILNLDQSKLKNIEEKLQILEKENQILKARIN